LGKLNHCKSEKKKIIKKKMSYFFKMAFSDLFSHIFNTKHFRVASGLVWRTKNKCEYINDLEENASSPGMIREWPHIPLCSQVLSEAADNQKADVPGH